MNIRRATAQDRESVRELLDAAFAPSTYESRLYTVAADGNDEHFDWVAEKDSRVAGYVLYTKAFRGKESIGFHIGPVAVHPDFQGQGVGSVLVRETLAQEPLDQHAVFVLGNPKYYGRFGFEPVSSARCPYNEDNSHFQALRWREADEEFSIGYAEAFTKAESGVALTSFSPEHTEELITMWRASFEKGVGITDPHPLSGQRDYLLTKLAPNHEIRLAMLDGRIVGFAAASPESLAQLYVHVDHQRRGIGSQLLAWAKEQSQGSLWLYTFDRNKGAQQFYESKGFEITARGFEEFWQLEDIRYEWTRKTS